MTRKEIVFVLFASILLISLFSFVSAGIFSNTFRKTQITGETIESACSDSDSGKDYFTKGTIIGGGVSFVQYDYCLILTSTGQTDATSCDSTNPDCKLHEFYCENNIRKGVRVSCDYGCSNGVCNPAPAQESSCSITSTINEGETQEIDGKTIRIEFMDATQVKMNIAGEITSSLLKGESEELSDGKIITLNNFYLPKNSNETGNVTFTFQLNSCYQEPTCIDSDGGFNYNIKGTVKWTSNTDSTNTEDYCQGNVLYETYCQYSATQTISHDCAKENKICSNGACVSNTSTNTLAKTYYPAPFVANGLADVAIIYGTQTGVSNLELVQANNLQIDLQERTTGVGELLVKDSERTSVLDKNLIVIGTPCSNSAILHYLGLSDCNSVTSNLQLAPGKAALKPVAGENGKLVLLVVGYSPEELTKMVLYLTTKEISTSRAYLLTVLEANQTVYIGENCTDTDQGINYFIKGTATYDSETYSDKCSLDNITVQELYCKQDGIYAQTYLCPDGCSNGACIKVQDINKTQEQIQNKTQEQNQTQYKNQTQDQNLNQGQSNKNLSSEDTGANCEFGCMLNEKCYPFGYRKAKQFCHENNTFIAQTINEAACENNFECRSNLCIDDECINQGAFKRMMNWFKNSFQKRNK